MSQATAVFLQATAITVALIKWQHRSMFDICNIYYGLHTMPAMTTSGEYEMLKKSGLKRSFDVTSGCTVCTTLSRTKTAYAIVSVVMFFTLSCNVLSSTDEYNIPGPPIVIVNFGGGAPVVPPANLYISIDVGLKVKVAPLLRPLYMKTVTHGLT